MMQMYTTKIRLWKFPVFGIKDASMMEEHQLLIDYFLIIFAQKFAMFKIKCALNLNKLPCHKNEPTDESKMNK